MNTVPRRQGTDAESYRQHYRQIYGSPDWGAVGDHLPWIHGEENHAHFFVCIEVNLISLQQLSMITRSQMIGTGGSRGFSVLQWTLF